MHIYVFNTNARLCVTVMTHQMSKTSNALATLFRAWCVIGKGVMKAREYLMFACSKHSTNGGVSGLSK